MVEIIEPLGWAFSIHYEASLGPNVTAILSQDLRWQWQTVLYIYGMGITE